MTMDLRHWISNSEIACSFLELNLEGESESFGQSHDYGLNHSSQILSTFRIYTVILFQQKTVPHTIDYHNMTNIMMCSTYGCMNAY